ncbi:hypothetical protein DNTS_013664 [Danionella cerebrum]|uniref:DNA cross-link repair 1A protein n=1 Tax=Danionella cerebrum TaxID=2873325 RepID=A0A553N4H1_9TELE|nr:hypothetical protein DNTS_013664 [Danionella translucida]
MSQSGSESDIWDYKPLKKTKKRSCKSMTIRGNGTKKRKESKTPVQNLQVISNETHTRYNQDAPNDCAKLVSKVTQNGTIQDIQGIQSDGHCPVCQMPFSLLVGPSQQWHVGECLDTLGDTNCKECPDGLQCGSTVPHHYRRYTHTLLAQSRAVNDSMAQATSDYCLKSVNDDVCLSGTASSVDSALDVLATSSQSSGYTQKGTPSQTNALLFLRSPNTEDLKKKKGWSPSVKKSQSRNSSQEAKVKISSPVEAHCVGNAFEVRKELFQCNDNNDEDISYSPLSKCPDGGHWLKHDESEQETVDSLTLFSDEDDEQSFDIMDKFEVEICRKQQTLLPPDSRLITFTSTGDSHEPTQHRPQSQGNSFTLHNEFQSPQSLVLEQLREQVSTPAHFKSLTSIYDELNSTQAVPSTQTLQTLSLKAQSMAPRRPKAGPSRLKQTDIGVFFGLKPLNDKKADKEVKGLVREQDSPQVNVASQGEGTKRPGKWCRKPKAQSEGSSDFSTAGPGETKPTQTEGRAEKQKRWNRGRATDGDPKEPRRCPFYKKIPGTGFAVDAFQYGAVDAVTAYFLTHFHSDHYGGLRKSSVFPIYCNKVTGNLVKSKLKVDEQYVHILPMNTECVVEGVKVTLLDANHCPGAAMLLFVLPDGQTVLHTGDFRADPSMERYPELQGLRIQTLYLDTTYCSPEYTFPTQDKVVTFAVNIAFEMVTLNPRTLVVCGTYAVGKEKVFLAISDILGSKVCLSKDKFNTMCCLESEEINQRITMDWQAAQVHVLPMMQINFKNLRTHLNRFSRKYDQLLAFKPTGWTFNQSVRVEDLQPETKGNISIYGIPYSEHSSYLEMKRFVQWLRPKKIIPTVNVGSWRSRNTMEGFFYEWLTEPRSLGSSS